MCAPCQIECDEPWGFTIGEALMGVKATGPEPGSKVDTAPHEPPARPGVVGNRWGRTVSNFTEARKVNMRAGSASDKQERLINS